MNRGLVGFGGNFHCHWIAVAVAQETSFVSFAGGYRHRSDGVQVVFADHDNGDDREPITLGCAVVDEAVSVVCWENCRVTSLVLAEGRLRRSS